MTEVVVEPQQTQPQTPAAPAAPASESVETSPKPEKQVGPEGTDKEEETETPQKRESRRARQLNRERERRIAAETELRLLREQRQEKQQPAQPAEGSDAPKREDFGTYEEFIRAEARYVASKEAKETARKEAEAIRRENEEKRSKGENESKVKAWNSQLEKARDEIEDFDEVCAESEATVTPAMSSAILESDKGALIAYFLAKNPAEAERISKLSPSKQAAAIVALEDKVAKPAKQPSKAPEPITPVGAKSEVEKDPSKMSDAEFAAYRRRQIAQRGRH